MKDILTNCRDFSASVELELGNLCHGYLEEVPLRMV